MGKTKELYQTLKKDNPLLLKIFVGVFIFVVLYAGGMLAQTILGGAPKQDISFVGDYEEPKTTYAIINVLMIALFSKNGWTGILFATVLLSVGVHLLIEKYYEPVNKNKDPFGRDFLFSDKDTDGTARWMSLDEMRRVLEVCPIEDATGLILGMTGGKVERSSKGFILSWTGGEVVTLHNDCPLSNRHIAVYGPSGAGKSRGFARPYILQCLKRRESYAVTDPKGEMYRDMSLYSEQQGFEVRVFNLVNGPHSDGWGSLQEAAATGTLVEGVIDFMTIVMENTDGEHSKDDFWTKGEKNLLQAAGLYILADETLDMSQKTFGAMYDLLTSNNFLSLDSKFSALPIDHPARVPWNIYSANDKTREGVLNAVGVRLSILQSDVWKAVTGYDEISLEKPAYFPCAYFLIMPDQKSTMKVLSSLFFSFLFVRIIFYADNKTENGQLPVPTHFILDEFPNIGRVPDFDKKIATVRSRLLNLIVIFQMITQLEEVYGKKWVAIIGNCDTELVLGCSDNVTADFLSNKLGKITIERSSKSLRVEQDAFFGSSEEEKGKSASTGGRNLMNPDELTKMPKSEVLICLTGYQPIRILKFDIDLHPEAKFLEKQKPSEHIPEWKKREMEQKMLHQRTEAEILESASFIKKTEVETKSVKVESAKINVAKDSIAYELGTLVSEGDFLADIAAVASDDSIVKSNFSEKVNFEKPGVYLVGLTTDTISKQRGVSVSIQNSKNPRVPKIKQSSSKINLEDFM